MTVQNSAMFNQSSLPSHLQERISHSNKLCPLRADQGQFTCIKAAVILAKAQLVRLPRQKQQI